MSLGRTLEGRIRRNVCATSHLAGCPKKYNVAVERPPPMIMRPGQAAPRRPDWPGPSVVPSDGRGWALAYRGAAGGRQRTPSDRLRLRLVMSSKARSD